MSESEHDPIIRSCLKKLCLDIGSRPAGSPAHDRAEEYLADSLKKFGYQVEVQGYGCPFWELDSYLLSAGNITLNAVPNTFSPSCDTAGSITVAESVEDLAQKDLGDKIVLLANDTFSEGFMPKNFDIFRNERQDAAIDLIEQKLPAVVIFASGRNEGLLPLIEDCDFTVPSITVPRRTGEFLKKYDGCDVRVRISSRRYDRRSSNIVARSVGNSNGRIVICAHYDTKYGTTGALDNASGVAVLLSLADRLKTSGKDIGLEFVLFGGEDSWYPGDAEYAVRNVDYLGTVMLAVNIDGIGFKGSRTSAAFLECPEDMVYRVSAVIDRHPCMLRGDPWYEGDHTLFWPRGIPSIALTSLDASGIVGAMIHTETDTLDMLDPGLIESTVEFVYEAVTSATGGQSNTSSVHG